MDVRKLARMVEQHHWISVRVVGNAIVLDRETVDDFSGWDAKRICEDATRFKFIALTREMCRPFYSLEEIQDAAMLIKKFKSRRIADKNLAAIAAEMLKYVEWKAPRPYATYGQVDKAWEKAYKQVTTI